MLRNEDDDWVKKCMEYEAEGPRPRERSKKTRREVAETDSQACKLNKEDAGSPGQRATERLCVCVCVSTL